jgi:hypothetical protein
VAVRTAATRLAVDLKAVPGIGAKIVLTVDGEWRKTRLFRSYEHPELGGVTPKARAGDSRPDSLASRRGRNPLDGSR